MSRPSEFPGDESAAMMVFDYLTLCRTREQMELPTMEGLAEYMEHDGDTLVEWAKPEAGHPMFSAAIKGLKGRQKKQLINHGLYGGKEVNQAMAIFLLKANHEMVETSHLDVTSKGNELKGPTVYIPEEKDE